MKKMDTNQVDTGKLQIQVNTSIQNRPINQATISISYTGNPSETLEQVTTDSNGRSPVLELPTPPLEYSMAPNENQPYSEYTIRVSAEGFAPVDISGSELLPGETSVQPVQMIPEEPEIPFEDIVIPAHTLFGEYPEKIPEDEIKPTNETGEIVLSRVVVPEYVIVHDGSPSDSTANNYYVRYRDYIKNVASSEIYATWPESSIIANCLAIISFTLNRVFTEWYRNKGYDFTITNSTAYDHFFVYGRNIFENISETVDMIFSNYLSRPGVLQPILTQYCDGRRVSCPNWMSQWGSKDLGEQGYSPIEILRYYYGDDIYINSAEQISGIPSSWPGYDLTIGSSGQKVQQMQEQLNRISDNYPAIPKIAADGIYGNQTAEAVRTFQKIFNLPQTGVTDYATWYKISQIYVGVSRIAELN